MSDIIITPSDTVDITLSNEFNTIELTPETNEIVISQKGVQGSQGPQGPQGEAAPLSWIDVAGDVEYTGAEITIASGDVLTADYKGSTVYRFIDSTENANGYPIEDSFYSDFDGTNLTNLIVTRGQ